MPRQPIKPEKLAVGIGIDARVSVKINKLGFDLKADIEEIAEEYLLTALSIYHPYCRVYFLAEALKRIYEPTAAGRALNEIVIRRIKGCKDIILAKRNAGHAEARAWLTVLYARHIKRKIASASLSVAHNECPKTATTTVKDKIAVGAHVLALAGAPQLPIVGKSYSDKLNELRAKALCRAEYAVGAKHALELIIGIFVVIVNISVQNWEFIAIDIVFRAEEHRIAVRTNIVRAIERKFPDNRRLITADGADIIHRSRRARTESKEQIFPYCAVLPRPYFPYTCCFHLHHLNLFIGISALVSRLYSA